jgi:hemerythrin-like metal-binding protein
MWAQTQIWPFLSGLFEDFAMEFSRKHLGDMPDMDWEHEHRVGIQEIDVQHKSILDCTLGIEQAIRRKDQAGIQAGLAWLLSLCNLHFMLEESLMRIHEFRDMDEHINHHHKLLAEIDRLHAHSQKAEISLDATTYLKEWWATHIPNYDKAYALHFLKRAALANR